MRSYILAGFLAVLAGMLLSFVIDDRTPIRFVNGPCITFAKIYKEHPDFCVKSVIDVTIGQHMFWYVVENEVTCIYFPDESYWTSAVVGEIGTQPDGFHYVTVDLVLLLDWSKADLRARRLWGPNLPTYWPKSTNDL